MKDFYVDEYKQEFIGLYDRNSDEFRKDLDRLIKMAYSAGATAEKHRMLSKVKGMRLTFGVDKFVEDTQTIIAVQVAKYLERSL